MVIGYFQPEGVKYYPYCSKVCTETIWNVVQHLSDINQTKDKKHALVFRKSLVWIAGLHNIYILFIYSKPKYSQVFSNNLVSETSKNSLVFEITGHCITYTACIKMHIFSYGMFLNYLYSQLHNMHILQLALAIIYFMILWVKTSLNLVKRFVQFGFASLSFYQLLIGS